MRATLLRAGAASVVPVAVGAPFLGRYGWHRDELYFVTASRHLALGYVDFPPLTAWIAWLVRQLVGDSLVALRLVSLACGVGSVFFVVLIARELGATARGELIAGFAWSTTPYVLGSSSIFHPTLLDLLAWAAACYVVTRIVIRRETRLWPLFGAIVGVGFEAKYTMAFLAFAVVVAMLAFDRDLLRGRGPWLAAAIAALLVVPNFVWQVEHGWPSLQFASSQNAQTAADTPPWAYVLDQMLFLGAALLVAVLGVHALWRRRLRALAAVPLLLFVLFLLERGRSYYPLPAYTIAVAGGAVALETRPRLVTAAMAIQLAALALVLPIVVAVLPERAALRHGYASAGFMKDEIGWPELARQVDAAARPAELVVTQNYGEASALERYAHVRVVSGHLSWQYWRPRRLPERRVLLVGYGEPRQFCARWTVVAHIDNAEHFDNEERGRPIVQCTLQRPLGAEWPRFATFNL